MKKIIATLSVILMSACAIALANDSDNTMNKASNDTTTSTSNTMGNAAGVAGSDMNNTTPNNTLNNDAAAMNHSTDVNSDSTSTTTTTKKTAKISKSCTDESGNVYKKGESGFKSCMKAQHEQSGIAADQSNSNADSNVNSDVPSHSSTY